MRTGKRVNINSSYGIGAAPIGNLYPKTNIITHNYSEDKNPVNTN